MSTRSQILFKSGNNHLLTYKHHGGYPDEVIPLVKKFINWFPRPNQFEYFTATWFYYVKRKEQLRHQDSDLLSTGDTDQPLELNDPIALGYGICPDNKIHSDIDHYYVVDLNERIIEHYGNLPPFTEEPRTTQHFEQKKPGNIHSLDPETPYPSNRPNSEV